MSPRPVLALDLGGTQIRAAVVLPDGSRLARVASETPSDDGHDAVLRACVDALTESRAAAPPTVGAALMGVGISSPGPVDPRSGIVVEPPNLGEDFRDVPLADEIEDAIGLPTFLDRDTNVAALGEAAFGAGRGEPDFIYLTVSTGVGGAIVTDGRLLHGPDGMAGELGHVPIELDGPMCGCGGVGHIEAIASGTGLARAAREAVAAGTSRYLADRAADVGVDELSAKDVAEGDEAGDATCSALMDRARRALGAVCAGYVNTFNPHRIIIGGAIAHGQGDRLLGVVREVIDRDAFRRQASRVEIVPPELGPDVSLAGAHPLVAVRIDDPIWDRGRGPASASLSAPATDMSIHTLGQGSA